MSEQKIKVRFAPSPTGYLHIGGARTALYNYLLAKQKGGQFVLRIEDTDLERSTPESIQAILDGMQWLGLDWDEGPFYQTKRFDIYQQYIDQLITEKKAYYCFCTPEEIAQKREQAQKEKRKPKYDRTCWQLSAEQRDEKLKAGSAHCVRFYSADDGETVVDDLIKGRVSFPNNELDDLIIRRSDGSPTYNLTVVIDDATMDITHVIRGDDHLNNTPRQIQLYQALNFNLPQFAHVPMILGSDKKRLSKRHGATSVMAYKDMGYLPQALINYLVRLGWSYGDQEVFSRQELIEKFTLNNVSHSAGVFNEEKLVWLNSVYIKECDQQVLLDLVRQELVKNNIQVNDDQKLMQAIAAVKEKIKLLPEFVSMIDFFFVEKQPQEQLQQKFLSDAHKETNQKIYSALENVNNWDEQGLHQGLGELMQQTGLKMGKIGQPLRVALTGGKAGPGLFDLLIILGKQQSLGRLKKYL